MADSIEARLAVVEANLKSGWREMERVRVRCHELESDRATVLILKRLVEDLQSDLPNLARHAAREAVSEYLQRQHANTLGNWRTYAALISAGAALGSLIVVLILHGP